MKTFRFIVLAAIVALLSVLPIFAAGNASEEAKGAVNYLLLLVDSSAPVGEQWAEVVVATHDLEAKTVSIDYLDGTEYAIVPGVGVARLGDLYSRGGVQLILDVLNRVYFKDVEKYAMTTYEGLGEMAAIFGYNADVDGMLRAGKQGNVATLRKEQMQIVASVISNVKKLTLEQVRDLFNAAYNNVESNVDVKDAFQLAVTMIGGGKLLSESGTIAVDI